MDNLISAYPWMPALAPVMGIALGWARQQAWLRGFGLLGTAVATAVVVSGAFGLSQGWGPQEWRAFPFTVILLVGESKVAGATFGTLLEKLGVKRVRG